MVNKLIKQIKANQQVFKNLTWLTLLQVANYLIPLIILFYIVPILGKELFGRISYAQNIIYYFTLFINYGFEYYATRYISTNRNDKNKITSIFWAILKQKFFLLVISTFALLFLYLFVDKVNQNPLLYLFVFLINLGFVLFPNWFFTGMEKMRQMAIFNFIIKLLGLMLTLLLVKSADDYLLLPLLSSISFIICGAIALLYVIKRYNLKYTQTDKLFHLTTIKQSTPIFLNNIFVAIYTISNITILGYYYGDVEVGIYSIAYRIIMAILLVTSMPINMALFPKICQTFEKSHQKGLDILIKVIRIIIPFTLLIGLFVFLTSDFLVTTVARKEIIQSTAVLRILCIIPTLVITASLLTIQGLYGMGLQKKAPYIGFTIGFISIILNFVLIPPHGINAVAISWIIAQSLEIIIVSTILFFEFRKISV